MTEDTNTQIGAYAGARGPELPSGMDRFLKTQEPEVKPVDDLSRFVLARIIELELEPRGEVDPFKNPEQAMAYRYAKHVREDCVVFRLIVRAYCGAVKRHAKRQEYDLSFVDGLERGARIAVLALANRRSWADHHEFRDEWRLA